MQLGLMSIRIKVGYHHGDLRRSLLTHAAALLEEVGSDALSIRELARRAGVSPRAPYQHFADKEALLSALAADAFKAFGGALAAAVRTAAPGREIEEQAVAYVRFARAAPGQFRLMFGPRRTQPEGDLAAAKAFAFSVLQAAAERAAAPGDDIRALALGYWSFAHGLAVLLLDGRVHEELSNDGDASVRRIATALLNSAPLGLESKPAPTSGD